MNLFDYFQLFIEALSSEFSRVVPIATMLARVIVRIGFAVLLTAIIGWEREKGNKTAGLRTHLMVAIGSALFVVVLENGSSQNPDSAREGVSRVIQGIAAGVGFIGGGAILKLESQNKVRGLTTAGSIWFAAAIGVCAGTGEIGAAIIGTAFAWLVLSSLGKLEGRAKPSKLILTDKNAATQNDDDDFDD